MCAPRPALPYPAPPRPALPHAARYEMFLDDLPIWGFVGEVRKDKVGEVGAAGAEEKAYIYTHKTFDVSYNTDRIIQVGGWVGGWVGGGGLGAAPARVAGPGRGGGARAWRPVGFAVCFKCTVEVGGAVTWWCV